jgi:hypothetical protein
VTKIRAFDFDDQTATRKRIVTVHVICRAETTNEHFWFRRMAPMDWLQQLAIQRWHDIVLLGSISRQLLYSFCTFYTNHSNRSRMLILGSHSHPGIEHRTSTRRSPDRRNIPATRPRACCFTTDRVQTLPTVITTLVILIIVPHYTTLVFYSHESCLLVCRLASVKGIVLRPLY